MQRLVTRKGATRMATPRRRAVHVLATTTQAAPTVFFRKAGPEDVQNISLTLWQEKMNPLGLEPERFTVAVDSANNLLGFAQLEHKETRGDKKIWEFRSLIVQAPYRGQGIGSQLVQEVVRGAAGGEVYLLTITKRKRFYERLGFQELPLHQVPGFMQFEVLAGSVVARVAVNDSLVAMRTAVD